MEDIFGSQSALFINHVTFAAIVVWFIQRLKPILGKLEWYQTAKSAVNRLLGVLLSGMAAVGIHCDFDSEAGVLTITGLTVAGIAKMLWLWVQQYIVQQSAWKGVKIANGRKQ